MAPPKRLPYTAPRCGLTAAQVQTASYSPAHRLVQGTSAVLLLREFTTLSTTVAVKKGKAGLNYYLKPGGGRHSLQHPEISITWFRAWQRKRPIRTTAWHRGVKLTTSDPVRSSTAWFRAGYLAIPMIRMGERCLSQHLLVTTTPALHWTPPCQPRTSLRQSGIPSWGRGMRNSLQGGGAVRLDWTSLPNLTAMPP